MWCLWMQDCTVSVLRWLVFVNLIQAKSFWEEGP